jgi:hypothetical protein
MAHADDCEATSPVVLTLQALRARQPKWTVEIGRPLGPNAAPVLPGDVPARDACVSPRGQLLSVLPPAPGALLCELPAHLR